ncbi:MAG TPA: OmpA family protein [Ignavibacteriaceae bacterium]|nr:OmpA family protein [Ignavibacteriaceae bacterium]
MRYILFFLVFIVIRSGFPTNQNNSLTVGTDNQFIKELKQQSYSLIKRGRVDNAVELLTQAVSNNPAEEEEIKKIRDVIFFSKKLDITPLKSLNISSNIYHPIVSDDKTEIYFCGYSNYSGFGLEDIYISSSNYNQWKKPSNLSNINTSSNESPSYVSSDKNTILFTAFYKKESKGDIYKALKNLKYKSSMLPSPINTTYFESDARIFQNNIMIFTSDRPGGVGSFREKGTHYNGDYWGNTDIYLSLLKDSVWQEPINLGPVINTEMAERTPYLTPDGKYLFFSSTGHTGFGGLDIFVSKRLSESSWTEWSEPVNLGYTVNSPEDDWGFMIIGDGKTAYFSNTKDIYSCILPDDFYNFDKQLLLSGLIKNELGKPVKADITLTGLLDNSVLQVSSDSLKGEYRISLDPFTDYKLVASASGYNPALLTLAFNSDTASYIRKDITLISQNQVRIDTSDGLITVFFEFNKYNLDKSFHPKLDYVANLLKTQSENSQVTIEIGGYTDAIGSEKYNEKLSLKRAQTVFGELIKRGLEDDSFDVKAYGESDPIAPNNTNEGRAKNRRVVLRIKNSL